MSDQPDDRFAEEMRAATGPLAEELAGWINTLADQLEELRAEVAELRDRVEALEDRA